MPARRPGPPPLPPPLRGIAIDGSNVIASSIARGDRRLELALQWCRDWRPDLPVAVFVDSATFGRCAAAVRARLQQWLDAPGAVPHGASFCVGPRATSADPLVLQHAVANAALVVSNDRFADHAGLRCGVVTLQFECSGDRFAPYPEATWFTPSGGATRVGLDRLQAG